MYNQNGDIMLVNNILHIFTCRRHSCDASCHARLPAVSKQKRQMSATSKMLLNVADLSVVFDNGKPTAHCALERVNLNIPEGGTVGLVGESGSGKTVLAHSILGLLPSNGTVTSGRAEWLGHNLLDLPEGELRQIRGKEIAMIFQDPQASLNPVFRVGHQIEWVLKLHRRLIGADAKAEVLRLFEAVQLRDPERCYRCYPHELSGGMCQRAMIAMAIACHPKLLIADEPTSALDVTTQAEILDLLREVRRQFSMSLLFISHDVGAVSGICDQVVVMLRGNIIESGHAASVFQSPQHPYTQGLVNAATCGRNLRDTAAQTDETTLDQATRIQKNSLEKMPCQP
ncbi:MAG: Vitamin B12 import ATP-binding protein BtuD [Verrucomicrobiae bacterium]|nr:Vitamin B12 import ATP-binding protein BtuD [Verrucomicrobiae bacterium]